MPDNATRSCPDERVADPVLARLDGMRILLVEDSIDNQRLLTHHLRKSGADVACAANGLIGVSMATTRGPFDIILMDMQMPEMDGYEASRALRSLGLELPIIALTAHAMSGDRQRCMDAGCNDYLTKPVHVPSLLQTCSRSVILRAP
jgi:CheY-like chemotaxis protein